MGPGAWWVLGVLPLLLWYPPKLQKEKKSSRLRIRRLRGGFDPNDPWGWDGAQAVPDDFPRPPGAMNLSSLMEVVADGGDEFLHELKDFYFPNGIEGFDQTTNPKPKRYTRRGLRRIPETFRRSAHSLKSRGSRGESRDSEGAGDPGRLGAWEVTTVLRTHPSADVELAYMDGPLSSARITDPTDVTIGPISCSLYFADPHHNTIRKISFYPNNSGEVTTHCGEPKWRGVKDKDGNEFKSWGPRDWGVPEPDQFREPVYIAVDRHENIYVGDTLNFRIPRISPEGKAEFYAGPLPWDGEPDDLDGKRWKGRFQTINGMDIDSEGNMYVMDGLSRAVRKVCNDRDGTIVTLRGDIPTEDRILRYCRYVACKDDGTVYVSGVMGRPVDSFNTFRMDEYGGHCVWRISPNGEISMYAGDGNFGLIDGPASESRFRHPSGLTVGPDGAVYVADSGNNCIRRISPSGDQVQTIAGYLMEDGYGNQPPLPAFGHLDGLGRKAILNYPMGITISHDGKTIFVADTLNSA
ncbi:hypothetical protein AAMO2058_000494000 [Amorphochlora amoebiformis]